VQKPFGWTPTDGAHRDLYVDDPVEALPLLDLRLTPDEDVAVQQRLEQVRAVLERAEAANAGKCFLMHRIEGLQLGTNCPAVSRIRREARVEKHIARAGFFALMSVVEREMKYRSPGGLPRSPPRSARKEAGSVGGPDCTALPRTSSLEAALKHVARGQSLTYARLSMGSDGGVGTRGCASRLRLCRGFASRRGDGCLAQYSLVRCRRGAAVAAIRGDRKLARFSISGTRPFRPGPVSNDQ